MFIETMIMLKTQTGSLKIIRLERLPAESIKEAIVTICLYYFKKDKFKLNFIVYG